MNVLTEFINTEHMISEQFFNILEKPATKKAMLTLIPKIRALIEEDPEFYDSYVYLAELYEQIGNPGKKPQISLN